jgi:hypothetical protein
MFGENHKYLILSVENAPYVRMRITSQLTVGRSVGQSDGQSISPSVLAPWPSGTYVQILVVVKTWRSSTNFIAYLCYFESDTCP